MDSFLNNTNKAYLARQRARTRRWMYTDGTCVAVYVVLLADMHASEMEGRRDGGRSERERERCMCVAVCAILLAHMHASATRAHTQLAKPAEIHTYM